MGDFRRTLIAAAVAEARVSVHATHHGEHCAYVGVIKVVRRDHVLIAIDGARDTASVPIGSIFDLGIYAPAPPVVADALELDMLERRLAETLEGADEQEAGS